MRIGEAANPGPHGRPQQREGHLDLEYASPTKQGFWEAKLPGAESGRDRGSLGVDDEGASRYQLVIETCNSTSWGTAAKYLLRTRADLVLVQEHRLPSHRIAAASSWARRRGWQTMWAPAIQGEGGGWSAGVCICARDPVSLLAPRCGGSIVYEARAVAALAEAPGYRPTACYSVYLRDGEGLSEGNLAILAETGRHVLMQGEGAPFVIGGDMQMSPQTAAVAGLGEKIHATLVASGCKRGTCRTAKGKSEIDYFYMEQGLARGIKEVATVEATRIRTHVPVRVTMHPRLTSAKALVVRKPPPLSTERLHGPLPPPA